MDWDHLKYFQAVADTGSLTGAMTVLRTSQSSISRKIKQLEEALNVRLFQRRAHGMILTAQGKRLLQAVHRVSLELHDFEAGLIDAREQPTGDLTVSCTQGLGNAWLVPRLGRFCEENPKVHVSLVLRDSTPDLENREVDVAITFERPTGSEVANGRLFSVRYGAFASSSYLDRFGLPSKLEHLAFHRVLDYGAPAPTHLQHMNWVADAARHYSDHFVPWMSIASVPALKVSAMSGHGIVALPTYLVEANELTPLLTEHWSQEIPVYMSYIWELRNTKKLEVFRRFLQWEARAWAATANHGTTAPPE